MEKVITKVNKKDLEQKEKEYWKAKTPEERLSALNFMISEYFNLDNELPKRFQGIPTITKCKLR